MYIYEVLGRPANNDDMLQNLDVAAATVAKKMHAIDFNSLGVSNYTKKYIRGYLENTNSVLQIYTYILYIALKSLGFYNLKDCVFVDYGGGTGIMSLLAREMGFGTILYVDIYDVSCKDAELIACSVDKSADKYIYGGVDELRDYVKNAGICVDLVVSYDVIEHIYDLDDFYSKMDLLSSNKLCIVCASSANMYNPMIRKKRVACQKKTEKQDRQHEWGHKERDSLQGYFSLRKEIISNFAPRLSMSEVESIAKNTRGLCKNDIEKCVSEYVALGNFAYRPDHLTNTCDPMTGNWNERLMSIGFLKNVVEKNGFNFSILNGYYGCSCKNLKGFLKLIINYIIRLSGKKGIYLSPYYVVLVEK